MQHEPDSEFFEYSLPPGSIIHVMSPEDLVDRLTDSKKVWRPGGKSLFLAVYNGSGAGTSTEYYEHKTRLLCRFHDDVRICSAGAVEENNIPAKERFRGELLRLASATDQPIRKFAQPKQPKQIVAKHAPFGLKVTTSLTANRVKLLSDLLRARKDRSVTVSVSRDEPTKRRFYYTIFGNSILMARLSLPKTMALAPVYVLVYSKSVVKFILQWFKFETGRCYMHIAGDENDAAGQLSREWQRIRKLGCDRSGG
jgi:hypothetical protein